MRLRKSQIIEYFKLAGERFLKGNEIEEWCIKDRTFKLSESQKKFINSKKRYCLYYGGYGCGKTLALLLKLIIFCLFFPNNLVLLGRKTLQDIERTILPDLFDLLPTTWYQYKVKEGTITFFNNSQIILFGLEALQEGSLKDIKKAQQKLKSLNLGAYFIDQLEEIEQEVFESLNARLRRMNVPIRQGNMTCNPANFWAYDYFIRNPKENVEVIQGSMLENKDNLPADYIEDQLNQPEDYIRRYVYGEWDIDILTENNVFPKEYIQRLERMIKKPIAIEEECEIWEQPKKHLTYQIGVDPSEGVIDPSSISVVSSEGKKVAKFNGYIPIPALVEKVRFLYFKYNKPLIIPEANSAGAALIEGIKDLKIYRRRVFEYREKKEVKKVGWKTTYASKKALIAHFLNLLRQDFVKIYDKQTIEEMKTFVWSDSAKQKGAGAQRGFHDDDVISTMLAYWDLKPSDNTSLKNALKEELKKLKRARIQIQNFI